tara:strand:- start:1298 stop:1786 length:489 start_codon:yes stop_codon:yes gene_type:complete
MQFKKYIKQRNKSIQGLRSLKDTLPKNIKKIINKRGYIYTETLNNWRYIVGKNLFKICYPKSYKTSNNFSVSTLVIMVERGHEVDLEYSKEKIIQRMNSFFDNIVVERIKITSFDNIKKRDFKEYEEEENAANKKYLNKIKNVKNEKIRESLRNLTKVFKKK